MKTLTAYYAHSIALYGTAQESRDIALIESLGFKVVNPSAKTYSHFSMEGFCKLAASCDLLIFRAFPDNKIGSGVGLEIATMQRAGKPVLELSKIQEKRLLTREETRVRIAGSRGEIVRKKIQPLVVLRGDNVYSEQDGDGWGEP